MIGLGLDGGVDGIVFRLNLFFPLQPFLWTGTRTPATRNMEGEGLSGRGQMCFSVIKSVAATATLSCFNDELSLKCVASSWCQLTTSTAASTLLF